jgi:hypothetical protein
MQAFAPASLIAGVCACASQRVPRGQEDQEDQEEQRQEEQEDLEDVNTEEHIAANLAIVVGKSIPKDKTGRSHSAQLKSTGSKWPDKAARNNGYGKTGGDSPYRDAASLVAAVCRYAGDSGRPWDDIFRDASDKPHSRKKRVRPDGEEA